MKRITMCLLVSLLILVTSCSKKGEENKQDVVGVNESYVPQTEDYKFEGSSLSHDKEESVYASADAYGNVTKTEVEISLKATESGPIEDVDSLYNVVNTKGDEDYEIKDGRIVFENHGSDIIYKGTTDKELPVSVSLTYYLNDIEVSAEELAHKSGHLKVVVSYRNNTTNNVPFIAITMAMLNKDKCRNLTVENGKIMNISNSLGVVLYGEPGMEDYLQLSRTRGLKDIKLNDTAYFEADVLDFTLDYTATVVSNGLVSEIVDDESDLNDILDKLNSFDDIKNTKSDLEKARTDLKKLPDEFVGNFETLKSSLDTLGDFSSTVGESESAIRPMFEAQLKSTLDSIMDINQEDEDELLLQQIHEVILSDANYNRNNDSSDSTYTLNAYSQSMQVVSGKYIGLMSIIPDSRPELKQAIGTVATIYSYYYSNQALRSTVSGLSETLNLNDLKNSVAEGVSALIDSIDEMEESLDDMNSDFNVNEYRNLINKVKKLRSADMEYDHFMDKLDGKTSSVSFIIETSQIK